MWFSIAGNQKFDGQTDMRILIYPQLWSEGIKKNIIYHKLNQCSAKLEVVFLLSNIGHTNLLELLRSFCP